MVVLLDTVILLRLVDRNDPLHATVRSAVCAVKVRGDVLVMAAQNVAEFWNVCTRPTSCAAVWGSRLPRPSTAFGFWNESFPSCRTRSPPMRSGETLVVSLGVVGVQVHDTRLVALMQTHGVTHILTLNEADFARFAGITALDPKTLVSTTP